MIEHLYIKNYKAFQRENIPLEEHALLIGTNNSGKTTVLEALDLFFNGVLKMRYIKDKNNPVIIECFIDEKRYRKVFSPPDYRLNHRESIGDFFELKDYAYLYIPSLTTKEMLKTKILKVNMHHQLRSILTPLLKKAYDYLDGKKDQEEVVFSRIALDIEPNKEDEFVSVEEQTNIIKNITYPKTIVGIDHVEDHFSSSFVKTIDTYFYQSIATTKQDALIDDYPFFVQALYKEDVVEERDTTLRLSHNQYDKTMLLVEGKYDVAWFEKALKLLGKYHAYRVIPCGGYGNIPHVESQLKKAGFKTLVVTDGDAHQSTSLNRDVIELYADVDYVNEKFNTSFDQMPTRKWTLFKAIHLKDDVVKKVLSSWAKNHMQKESPFVLELNEIIS